MLVTDKKGRKEEGPFREYLERAQKIFGSVSIDRCEAKRASVISQKM